MWPRRVKMPTQNSEVWSVFCCCCLVEVTKLNLGQNSEARFGTQPPGSVVPLAMIVLHLVSCRSYVVFFNFHWYVFVGNSHWDVCSICNIFNVQVEQMKMRIFWKYQDNVAPPAWNIVVNFSKQGMVVANFWHPATRLWSMPSKLTARQVRMKHSEILLSYFHHQTREDAVLPTRPPKLA